MKFQRELLYPCPKCKEISVLVIETRHTKVSTRRRKKCRDCGCKFTTHEVSEDYFQESRLNRSLLSKLKKAIDNVLTVEEEDDEEVKEEVKEVVNPVQSEYCCDKCAHMMKNICTLGIPEFNTDEADECTYFITDESNLLVAMGIKVPT